MAAIHLVVILVIRVAPRRGTSAGESAVVELLGKPGGVGVDQLAADDLLPLGKYLCNWHDLAVEPGWRTR